jgi:hypothetical protein
LIKALNPVSSLTTIDPLSADDCSVILANYFPPAGPIYALSGMDSARSEPKRRICSF